MTAKLPVRRFALEKVMALKSQINAIGVIQRLLERDDITKVGAARELGRLQSNLYQISQTPRK